MEPSDLHYSSKDRMSLTIEEPTGVRREKWPVRRGIPFPKGLLAASDALDHIRLLDPNGRETFCYTRELARWPDESVKWLLFEFQVDLEPQERAEYTLEYGDLKREACATALSLTETEQEIAVTTGPLRFTVGKSPFSLLNQAWLDDEKMLTAPQRLWITGPDGTVYDLSADPVPRVEVEEQNPLRIVLKATGQHRSSDGGRCFDYLVRIYAYAGLPWIEMEYTFINTEDEQHTVLKEIALRTAAKLRGDGVGLCGAARNLYESADPFYCYHDQVMVNYGVFQGSPIYGQDGTLVEGVGMYEQKLARGWLDLSDGEKGITVAMRDFVLNYPKKASFEDGTITFHIWPEQAGPLKLHQGMAKTHTFMMLFHRGSGRDARVNEIATCLDDPLLPWNGTWYLKSKAFGEVFPHKPRQYPWIERALRDLTTELRDRRDPGMIDYGDYGGGTTEHRAGFKSNNEHDIPHGLLLQYLRTGERIPYQLAEAGVWHTMDIDIVHHTSHDPIERGGWRIHGREHVQYDPEGFPEVSIAPSHMWTESLVEYYYLTGYPRALQTARGVADCLVRLIEAGWATPPYHSEWHSARDSGWPLIGLSAVYEATGEEKYRRAMGKVVEALRDAQHENGGWPIVLWFNVAYCPFQMSVALTGLMRYHQVTGDEEAKEVFLKGMKFLAGEEMRFPDGAWMYVSAPEYRATYYADGPLEPFGYAYQLTGDKTYIDQGLISFGRGFDLRASLRFMYWADQVKKLRDV